MDKIQTLRAGTLILGFAQLLVILVAVTFFLFPDLFLLSLFLLAVLLLIGYFFLLLGFEDKAGYGGALLFFVAFFLFLLNLQKAVEIAESLLAFRPVQTAEFLPLLLIPLLYVASNVLVGIGFYNLGRKYNSNMLKVAGSLLGASIAVDVVAGELAPFLAIFSFFLAYAGLSEIRKKLA